MKLIEQDTCEVSGLTTSYWLRQDGKITVQVTQDAEPILDGNRQQFNAHSSKGRRDYGEGGAFGTQVARIPQGVVSEVLMKTGVNLQTCDVKTLCVLEHLIPVKITRATFANRRSRTIVNNFRCALVGTCLKIVNTDAVTGAANPGGIYTKATDLTEGRLTDIIIRKRGDKNQG